MDIEILEMTETSAKFKVVNSSPEVVNALRRVLLSEIPKMAIDVVEFHLGPIKDAEGREYESVSPLFDEIVAHRLGLVPIPTDLSMKERDKCECGGEGCPSCMIGYSLFKTGPCDVYSGDLLPLTEGDSSVRVKDDMIPIVRLGEGQAILVYAFAELGTGKKHAKWQVTSGVGYKYLPTVKIDPSKCDDGGRCIPVCPKHVFAKEGDKVKVVDEKACILCMACVNPDVCKTGAIKVVGDPTKFIFEFETDGSLSAKDTLLKGLEILQKKFDDFKEMVSSLEA
ncbi:MAG: DNA-directed RNA polymerase subunit D [Methanomassiliicoccales archaeon]|nr:MAG: DNA-directed RNA polymerase subunit D [Methanomassiliicoccales archaeon]